MTFADACLLLSALVALGAAAWTLFVMWPFIRLSRAEMLAGRESRERLDRLVTQASAYLAFYHNFKARMEEPDDAPRI